MPTGHVFIATSLDGFVARMSGALDWLMKQPTEGEDHGYDAFMASVDGLVMGRGSFEAVRAFDEWPYEKPVVVMSRTLGQDDVPAEIADRVTLTRLDPAGVMKMLDGQGLATGLYRRWQGRAVFPAGRPYRRYDAHPYPDPDR